MADWKKCSEFETPEDCSTNEMIKEETERLRETAKHCSKILDNSNNSDILSVKMLKNEKRRCEQLAGWLEELEMYRSLAPRELTDKITKQLKENSICKET